MKVSFLATGLFAAGVLAANMDATISGRFTSCKCFPGDSCWPSSGDWDKLNSTVAGRLIATVPLAEACHDPNYDPVKCAALQAGWQNPGTQ